MWGRNIYFLNLGTEYTVYIYVGTKYIGLKFGNGVYCLYVGTKYILLRFVDAINIA